MGGVKEDSKFRDLVHFLQIAKTTDLPLPPSQVPSIGNIMQFVLPRMWSAAEMLIAPCHTVNHWCQ